MIEKGGKMQVKWFPCRPGGNLNRIPYRDLKY